MLISILQNYTAIRSFIHHSDEELWQGIQCEDSAMFEALYHRYVLQLSNQAYKLLQDEDQIKDILQEVFVGLYLQRHELPATLNPGAYLTTSVKNKSLNRLRDLKRKYFHEQEYKEIHSQRSEKSLAESTELRMQLNRSILELEGKSKQVFFLRHYANKSHREIGLELGISSRSVEKYIGKALQKLRQKLKGE